MNENGERTQADDAQRATFQFDCGQDWSKLGADMSRLCATVGEQVRKAMAEVDFDAVRAEIDKAMQQMRQTAEEQSQGPAFVRVNVHTGQAAPAKSRPAASQEERLIVLNLVAEGKITPEEAARLLEALGD